MRILNLFDGEWDEQRDRPGWRLRRQWVGDRLGAERIGASLYDLPPGERMFPYHFHYGEEEWLLVLSGRPTLRTPAGERELVAGDLVEFPRGRDGAHALRNATDEPSRVLLLSSRSEHEIIEYPDSGKIGVFAPDLRKYFRRDSDVDYFDGELE